MAPMLTNQNCIQSSKNVLLESSIQFYIFEESIIKFSINSTSIQFLNKMSKSFSSKANWAIDSCS